MKSNSMTTLFVVLLLLSDLKVTLVKAVIDETLRMKHVKMVHSRGGNRQAKAFKVKIKRIIQIVSLLSQARIRLVCQP